MKKVEVTILLVLAVSTVAVPKPEEKKERVIDRELSDKEHYENEHHNTQYDHEAFLGEEAKTFDQLSPEESRRRLGYVGLVITLFFLIQFILFNLFEHG